MSHKRYHLSSEQQTAFVTDLEAVGRRLLAITFDAPDTDHQNIRHHAYLKGKFEQLTSILEDSFPDPEQPSLES